MGKDAIKNEVCKHVCGRKFQSRPLSVFDPTHQEAAVDCMIRGAKERVKKDNGSC